jgi:hypothetical protein
MKQLLFATFLLLSLPTLAQIRNLSSAPFDTANRKQPYYILLRDGSFIQGRILRQDSTMFTIRLRTGQLSYVEKNLFDRISDQRPADNPINNDIAQPAGMPTPQQPTAITPVPNQPPGQRQYLFTLRNGTKVRGQLIRQDTIGTIVRTSNLGEVRIPDGQLLRMEMTGSNSGNYGSNNGPFPNQFPQIMNLTPTAFSVARGKVYYHNYYLYISQFEYGITDNWSVGTTFYSFLPTNLFSIVTKFSVPVSARVRLGASAQYGVAQLGGEGSGIGFLRGIATFGDTQNNTTIGLGAVAGQGGISNGGLLTIGTVRKITPRTTLISENQILLGVRGGSSVILPSIGLRFDRKRHAFDLSVIVPVVTFNRNNSVPFFILPFGAYRLRLSK